MFIFNAEVTASSGLVKDFDARSQGQWKMWMDCTHIPQKIPDIKVLVYGTNGISLAQRVHNLKNEPFLVGLPFLIIKMLPM